VLLFWSLPRRRTNEPPGAATTKVLFHLLDSFPTERKEKKRKEKKRKEKEFYERKAKHLRKIDRKAAR
jgi:hypothetical protein